MSYEVHSKPKKFVAKTTQGRIFFWTEEYGKKRPEIRASTRPSENALLESSLLSSGATDSVELSYEQFFEVIRYVFENEYLSKKDPRLDFLKEIRATRIKRASCVEGHNRMRKRLVIP